VPDVPPGPAPAVPDGWTLARHRDGWWVLAGPDPDGPVTWVPDGHRDAPALAAWAADHPGAVAAWQPPGEPA